MSVNNIEEARLSAAEAALGALLPSSAWRPRVSLDTAPRFVGEQLWAFEPGDRFDDRPLYWQRLALQKQLKSLGRGSAHLSEFELASRGMLDVRFSSEATYRVLITGFDPFHLDDHVDQGNPSGAIARQHHGKKIETRGGLADVRSMIFPVRYSDFDEFLVERVLETVRDKLDMVITVSMGRTGFDLERFPGRRRSVTTLDNLGREGGGSLDKPVVPAHLEGPEYVEFSLPVEAMKACRGDFQVNDNRLVTSLEQGEFEAANLANLSSQTAVLGSGGGYLSNEISYRVLRLLQETSVRSQRSIPAGHIHTPRMQGYDRELVQKISEQCGEMIDRAIHTLV